MKPVVAIVGRANVGKSTLFNRLTHTRRAIVDDFAGVTRDRLYEDVTWCGKTFTLIDTGGIELKSNDEILKNVRFQAEIAIDESDVILYVVDATTGITGDDEEVAQLHCEHVAKASAERFCRTMRVQGRHVTQQMLSRLY